MLRLYKSLFWDVFKSTPKEFRARTSRFEFFLRAAVLFIFYLIITGIVVLCCWAVNLEKMIPYSIVATLGIVWLLQSLPLLIRRIHDINMGGIIVVPFFLGVFVEFTLPAGIKTDIISLFSGSTRWIYSSFLSIHIFLFLFLLFLFLFPGTKGPNKYGFTDNTDEISRFIKQLKREKVRK
jgi:uncharacterized membrane protein YhaH (DUF805 family)